MCIRDRVHPDPIAPGLCFSITSTFRPNLESSKAAEQPIIPAPTITTSIVSTKLPIKMNFDNYNIFLEEIV